MVSRTDEVIFVRDAVLNQAGSEKRAYQIYYDQPRPTSPIRAAPSRSVSKGGRFAKEKRERARRNESERGWMDQNFRSGTRRTRRPQISTPFNFQHTSTGAVTFTATAPRSAPLFRPLELSIYDADNHVSPLLPYFIGPNPSTSPPPQRARSRTEGLPDVFDDDDTTLAHSRSYSDLSFHIPRRPVNDGSSVVSNSNFGDSPPQIPPRAAARRTRQRAFTSPSVERIVERIASAMIEKDKLDTEIASIKERHSICMLRPSTSYDLGELCHSPRTGQQTLTVSPDEPMPAFPIVPPTAPSFAERVSIDRPRTAPSTQSAFYPPPPPPPIPAPVSFMDHTQALSQPARRQPTSVAPITTNTPSKQAVPTPTSAFNSHPPWTSPRIIDNSADINVPLAPPLPLILRPPLRKKKSFSRVSDWLFPAGTAGTAERETTVIAAAAPTYNNISHRRDPSRDSVTNTPVPLTDREGFYQTLPPSAVFSGRRGSFDSMSDVSSRPHSGSIYSTDEDSSSRQYGGGATVATSTQWSPGSTPPEAARRAADKRHAANLSLSGMSAGRTGTFGSETEKSSPVEDVEEANAKRTLQVRKVREILTGPRPTSVGVAF